MRKFRIDLHGNEWVVGLDIGTSPFPGDAVVPGLSTLLSSSSPIRESLCGDRTLINQSFLSSTEEK